MRNWEHYREYEVQIFGSLSVLRVLWLPALERPRRGIKNGQLYFMKKDQCPICHGHPKDHEKFPGGVTGCCRACDGYGTLEMYKQMQRWEAESQEAFHSDCDHDFESKEFAPHQSALVCVRCGYTTKDVDNPNEEATPFPK